MLLQTMQTKQGECGFIAIVLCAVPRENKKDKTGAVIPAILSHDFGICSQVDLTDMQSSSHQKQYHWIIVYQCPLINVCVVG